MPTEKKKGAVNPQQVIDLHDQGKGRNEIARELHTTTYRVDQAAKQAGIIFDGAMTEQANRARLARSTQERMALTARLRDVAYTSLGEALDTTIPLSERKQAVIMAAICIDKDNDLSERVAIADALDQQQPDTNLSWLYNH